jgi:hypothetical protein
MVEPALDFPHVVVPRDRYQLYGRRLDLKKKASLPSHNDPRIFIQRPHVYILPVCVVAAPLVNKPLGHLSACKHDQGLLSKLESKYRAIWLISVEGAYQTTTFVEGIHFLLHRW